MAVHDAAAAPVRSPSTGPDVRVNPVRAWSVTAMAVLFIVVNWADKAILGIAAQPLMADLGLTAADIGFIGSAFYFLFSITGVVTGFVADRVGMRWVLFTLALLWSVTQLPVLLWATGAALLVGRIALGAAEGPGTAMASVASFGWFPPERRALPSALVSSGASIAKIAIAPVLTLIVVTWGWRAAFVALAVFGVVWAGLWLLIGKPGPYAVRTPDARASAPSAPLRVVLTRPTFIGAVVGTFTMYGLVTVVLTWLPSYFETGLGFSRLEAGSMLGLPSIVGMVVMIGVSAWTDRRLARGASSRVMRGFISAAGLVFGGGLLAVLPLVGAPAAAVAIVSVGYGIGAVCLPLMSASVSLIAPAARQSTVLGIFLALQALSGLIAPAVTGLIVDGAASPAAGYALSFQVFGLAAVVGGVVVALIVRPDRDRETVARATPAVAA
ncbi:MFS transporter [Pseudonocardia halophobica]|uniref:MFS transporter n=1 Tax=Pseudonocardia halophobica TaxID=29401 RepID=UPI003D8A0D07